MKIGVDVDGVLRNWADSLVKNYYYSYPMSQITPISLWKKYEIDQYFWNGGNVRNFFINELPEKVYGEAHQYEGASNFIKNLKEKGHDVHIISYQPSKRIEDITTAWLVKNDIKDVTVHYTKEKHKIPLDMMLDDYTENLKEFKNVGNGYPVAFTRPWNSDWDYMRVSSFKEFLVLTDAFKYVREE